MGRGLDDLRHHHPVHLEHFRQVVAGQGLARAEAGVLHAVDDARVVAQGAEDRPGEKQRIRHHTDKLLDRLLGLVHHRHRIGIGVVGPLRSPRQGRVVRDVRRREQGVRIHLLLERDLLRQLLGKLDVNLRARVGVLAKLVRDDGLERVAVAVVVAPLFQVHFDALGVRPRVVGVVLGQKVLLRKFEIDVAALLHRDHRQQLLRDKSFVPVRHADVGKRLINVEGVQRRHVSSRCQVSGARCQAHAETRHLKPDTGFSPPTLANPRSRSS